MTRYLLKLSFDGTDFFGWAKQPNFRTVQSTLETALSKVLKGMWGKDVQTIVSGRTDTGVHCREQFVHFDYDGSLFEKHEGQSVANTFVDAANALPINRREKHEGNAASFGSRQFGAEESQKFLKKLNSVLPDDVVASAIAKVPSDFSARFWAKSRTYKFRIADSISCRNPLRRSDILWHKAALDEAKMNRAIRKFVGLHDFSAFVKPRDGQTAVRKLTKFSADRARVGKDRGLVVITLKADAFAYNMCRSLVGALIMVGDGRREKKWMWQKLQGKVREGATGPTAAKGLTLEKIALPFGFRALLNFPNSKILNFVCSVSAKFARKRERKIKARRA